MIREEMTSHIRLMIHLYSEEPEQASILRDIFTLAGYIKYLENQVDSLNETLKKVVNHAPTNK